MSRLRGGACSVATLIHARLLPALTTAAAFSAKATPRGGPRTSTGTSFLSAEIQRMKKAYEIYNKRPPKPFKLRSESGNVDLVLQRRKGSEDILVRCELLFHPRGGPPEDLTPEELGGEEQSLIVNLILTITKGGPQELEVSVECHRNGYAINHIKYRENKKDVKVEEDDDYFPEFWRVSSELRTEFHNFLEARGLDEKLANWVHDQMDDKAFRERLRVLEKVNAFVEGRPISQ